MQTSMILSLNVLNSRLCCQRSNLRVSPAGAAQEGTKRRDVRSWRALEIPGDFYGRSSTELLPVCSCSPNATACCGASARPSQKQLQEPEGGFFQLLKPQVGKSAGIQQVRQAKASTDSEVLSAG